MKTIASSELIIHPDGSVFHLRIRPEQLADRIILVGDPGRVDTVAARLDAISSRHANREFVSVTGTYHGTPVTVLSTGIGTDNIDIVVTELDALANVDFRTRTVKEEKRTLTLVRLGTSGALQEDIPIGTFLLAKTSVGFDGLLNFYGGRDQVCDREMEADFVRQTEWPETLPAPYFIHSCEELNEWFREETMEGITVSAPGFYGPQGRIVRLPLAMPDINARLENYRYRGRRITNYEMESSALAGLAALLGHRATTVCTVIAQRANKESDTDYQRHILRLIDLTLQKLAGF